MKTLDKNNLKISVLLYNFINEEVIPGTNIESGKFWEGFSNAVHELAPINKQLLKKRGMTTFKLVFKFLQILSS